MYIFGDISSVFYRNYRELSWMFDMIVREQRKCLMCLKQNSTKAVKTLAFKDNPLLSSLMSCHNVLTQLVAELRWPEGPPGGAQYPYKKEKKTREFNISWLSWLAVLLVGAYARRRRRRQRRRRTHMNALIPFERTILTMETTPP